MANAQTEHSKKLRAKTAAAYTKRALEDGSIRRIMLQLQREDADEFDAIAKAEGLSRPQALKMLCALYRKSQKFTSKRIE